MDWQILCCFFFFLLRWFLYQISKSMSCCFCTILQCFVLFLTAHLSYACITFILYYYTKSIPFFSGLPAAFNILTTITVVFFLCTLHFSAYMSVYRNISFCLPAVSWGYFLPFICEHFKTSIVTHILARIVGRLLYWFVSFVQVSGADAASQSDKLLTGEQAIS